MLPNERKNSEGRSFRLPVVTQSSRSFARRSLPQSYAFIYSRLVAVLSLFSSFLSFLCAIRLFQIEASISQALYPYISSSTSSAISKGIRAYIFNRYFHGISFIALAHIAQHFAYSIPPNKNSYHAPRYDLSLENLQASQHFLFAFHRYCKSSASSNHFSTKMRRS